MNSLGRVALVLAMVTAAAGVSVARAADMRMEGRVPEGGLRERFAADCERIWVCRGDLCGYKRVCWRGCPDRYSCSPLYGAYGPYGGGSYWGAYSYGNLRSYQY